MSLVEKLKEWYEEEVAPPLWVSGFNLVSEESSEKKRWGELKVWVFQEGDEYVAVQDVEPATEMQEWGDYGEPEIYEVEPVEVTVVKYRRKT